MKSILFVCTGNIFRSVTAEYALRATLRDQSNYVVTSAGTVADPQPMHPFICERLSRKGVDASRHQQRRLSKAILSATDLIVAMGLDHRLYIQSNFGREAILFKQVCYQKDEPVLDIPEVIPDWESNLPAAKAYVISVVDDIWESIPAFVRNLHTVDTRDAKPLPSATSHTEEELPSSGIL